ncbi:MAG TPA: hypothetical protein VM554_11315 [Acidisarcina sp.]|nr:hypothetical protein [Acidisarcina sp.]
MHLTGTLILLIFSVLAAALLFLLVHLTSLGHLIHTHIADRPRRRMFYASVSFFVTFSGLRLLVFAIVHHVGPFHWVEIGGRHIHHLVWGILLLLALGYGWLAEIDQGDSPSVVLLSRLMSVIYGVAAALTLDEFALWFNLEDVYWAPEGRESIDAVILFGSLLSIAAWGAPLFSALLRPRKVAQK